MTDKGHPDLKRMKERLELQDAEIERLQGEIDTLMDHAVEYQERYRAVMQSRSWRYTAPARFIKKLLSGDLLSETVSEPPKRSPQQSTRPGSATRDIEALRKQMLSRGFVRQAGKELIEIANDERRPYHRRLAALELAVWHLNKRTPEGARRALALIPVALYATTSHRTMRRGAILKAEAYTYLGDLQRARGILKEQADLRPHHDLYLGLANLEDNAEAKLGFINRAMELCGLTPLGLSEDGSRPLYDRLTCVMPDSAQQAGEGPLVSVIMPAHNSADTISTAIEAVLNQSWRNLELFVVDDCSTDETSDVVESFADRDGRVRLIRAKTNAGPYVARNLALPHVTGEFVTCHDADDWSHPEKIALQVAHLVEDPNCVGNSSMQARTTNQLHFYRRGNLGDLTISNYSSFMFRREPILDALGYWDSVRFAADSEFIHRVRTVFGENSVAAAGKGPLSFQRQSDASLTGNSAFGFHGFYMGARLAYYEAHRRHHQRATSLKYDFPQESRPFGVPEPFWPEREYKAGSPRYYDVVIADDLRLGDPAESSLVADVRDHLRAGRRVGLVQLSRYRLNPHLKIDPAVVDLLDDPNVDQIVYGEKVSCNVVIVRSALSLSEHQRLLPDIETENLRIIIDCSLFQQPFDLRHSASYLKEYFGQGGTWHPLNATARKQFLLIHDDVSPIELSQEDWHREIVDSLFSDPARKTA